MNWGIAVRCDFEFQQRWRLGMWLHVDFERGCRVGSRRDVGIWRDDDDARLVAGNDPAGPAIHAGFKSADAVRRRASVRMKVRQLPRRLRAERKFEAVEVFDIDVIEPAATDDLRKFVFVHFESPFSDCSIRSTGAPRASSNAMSFESVTIAPARHSRETSTPWSGAKRKKRSVSRRAYLITTAAYVH